MDLAISDPVTVIPEIGEAPVESPEVCATRRRPRPACSSTNKSPWMDQRIAVPDKIDGPSNWSTEVDVHPVLPISPIHITETEKKWAFSVKINCEAEGTRSWKLPLSHGIQLPLCLRSSTPHVSHVTATQTGRNRRTESGLESDGITELPPRAGTSPSRVRSIHGRKRGGEAEGRGDCAPPHALDERENVQSPSGEPALRTGRIRLLLEHARRSGILVFLLNMRIRYGEKGPFLPAGLDPPINTTSEPCAGNFFQFLEKKNLMRYDQIVHHGSLLIFPTSLPLHR